MRNLHDTLGVLGFAVIAAFLIWIGVNAIVTGFPSGIFVLILAVVPTAFFVKYVPVLFRRKANV